MLRPRTMLAPGTDDPVLIVIESAKGRDAFLARAASSLPKGECLVRVLDIVGMRRSVRTVPKDPRAALVAKEPPLVLRGGLTTLVSYYRVPSDALGALETHETHGLPSYSYDTTLAVVAVGEREAPVPA